MYRFKCSFEVRKNQKLKDVSDFTVNLGGFSFFCTSFSRKYANIISNLFDSLKKNIIDIQLISSQLYEITTDYLFNVT